MWIEATYWTMQLQITETTLNNLLSEIYSNFITRQHTIFFLNKESERLEKWQLGKLVDDW